VSITTLKSKAAADVPEFPYDIRYGKINPVHIQFGQGRLTPAEVLGIVDKVGGLRERFHLLCFLTQVNVSIFP
jgi:hypothetical protein